MRILFDHNTPRPLRRYLAEHSVHTAADRGWHGLTNGDLLAHAEREGYKLLITADQSLPYQQNLNQMQIAILILSDNRWPCVRERIAEIHTDINDIAPGEIREVPIPAST